MAGLFAVKPAAEQRRLGKPLPPELSPQEQFIDALAVRFNIWTVEERAALATMVRNHDLAMHRTKIPHK